MSARRACAVAAVAVLAAACGDAAGNGDGESAGTTTTTALVPGQCLERSATVRRHTPPGETDVHLVDARVARLDDCADEVVFEFRSVEPGFPPGYEIGYEDGPTFVDFTSGDEFDVSGEAFLVIRFERTGTVEVTGPEGEAEFTDTYVGLESIVPSGMNHLLEARIVQAPEGMVQWVIGLDSERPFTVDSSTLPRPLPDEPTDPAPDDETISGEATARVVLRIG